MKIYIAFAVMVTVTLAIVIGQLRQLRIYEAIKPGRFGIVLYTCLRWNRCTYFGGRRASSHFLT